jgi:hypothetical protein
VKEKRKGFFFSPCAYDNFHVGISHSSSKASLLHQNIICFQLGTSLHRWLTDIAEELAIDHE